MINHSHQKPSYADLTARVAELEVEREHNAETARELHARWADERRLRRNREYQLAGVIMLCDFALCGWAITPDNVRDIRAAATGDPA